jgi:hypothetical protein
VELKLHKEANVFDLFNQQNEPKTTKPKQIYMITVTLVYGRESMTKELPSGSTVSDLAKPAILSALGAPTERTRFTLDGSEVDGSDVLEDGDEVFVERKPCGKAA